MAAKEARVTVTVEPNTEALGRKVREAIAATLQDIALELLMEPPRADVLDPESPVTARSE